MGYDTGRTVLSVILGIGVVVFAAGVFFAFGGLARDGLAGLLVLLPVAISGLVTMAAAVVGMATIDTAENTGAIAREIERQGRDAGRGAR